MADDFQIVGPNRLPGTLSTRPSGSSVKVLEASHAPIVALVAPKFTPVVVKVTSASAVGHAAVALWQVGRARLAAIAPVC
jgi:hypothetical protein